MKLADIIKAQKALKDTRVGAVYRVDHLTYKSHSSDDKAVNAMKKFSIYNCSISAPNKYHK